MAAVLVLAVALVGGLLAGLATTRGDNGDLGGPPTSVTDASAVDARTADVPRVDVRAPDTVAAKDDAVPSAIPDGPHLRRPAEASAPGPSRLPLELTFTVERSDEATLDGALRAYRVGDMGKACRLVRGTRESKLPRDRRTERAQIVTLCKAIGK